MGIMFGGVCTGLETLFDRWHIGRSALSKSSTDKDLTLAYMINRRALVYQLLFRSF
jgi:hypothetical protein